jgi:hypothetical protein
MVGAAAGRRDPGALLVAPSLQTRESMRIAIVGGAERIEARLRDLAEAAGHELDFHPGHMSGPASDRLRALVERCDLLVIITEINSHAAVLHARSLARKSGRPVRLVRRLGTSQLRGLMN